LAIAVLVAAEQVVQLPEEIALVGVVELGDRGVVVLANALDDVGGFERRLACAACSVICPACGGGELSTAFGCPAAPGAGSSSSMSAFGAGVPPCVVGGFGFGFLFCASAFDATEAPSAIANSPTKNLIERPFKMRIALLLRASSLENEAALRPRCEYARKAQRISTDILAEPRNGTNANVKLSR
jgi:hypothetical protein